MRIIGISDIHGRAVFLHAVADQLVGADVVLLGGDLTHFGGEKEAMEVVRVVTRYNRRVLAVAGNCDQAEAAQALTEMGVNLSGGGVMMNGVGFVGAGGSLPCPGRTPSELSEEELDDLIAEGFRQVPAGSPTVMVVHQPPYDTGADVVAHHHVGSQSVWARILKHKPLVCFSGHIHEAVGVFTLGETRIVNPGPLSEGRYAHAVIERQGGGFRLVECEVRSFIARPPR